MPENESLGWDEILQQRLAEADAAEGDATSDAPPVESNERAALIDTGIPTAAVPPGVAARQALHARTGGAAPDMTQSVSLSHLVDSEQGDVRRWLRRRGRSRSTVPLTIILLILALAVLVLMAIDYRMGGKMEDVKKLTLPEKPLHDQRLPVPPPPRHDPDVNGGTGEQ